MIGKDKCPFCAYADAIREVFRNQGNKGDAPWPDLVEDVHLYSMSESEQGAIMIIKPHSPVNAGHRLLVPLEHVPASYEMATSAQAFELENQAAMAIRAATSLAMRAGTSYNLVLQAGSVGGQSVEHYHLHYVPRSYRDGLGYRWKKVNA